MGDTPIKQCKTFTLRLTKFELLHLRDLFSVMLPPEMKETLSQRLAQSQDRALIEAKLWQKLAQACRQVGLPMDDDAPDFVVAASASPPVSIFELAHEPVTPPVEEEHESTGLFGDDDGKKDEK